MLTRMVQVAYEEKLNHSEKPIIVANVFLAAGIAEIVRGVILKNPLHEEALNAGAIAKKLQTKELACALDSTVYVDEIQSGSNDIEACKKEEFSCSTF